MLYATNTVHFRFGGCFSECIPCTTKGSVRFSKAGAFHFQIHIVSKTVFEHIVSVQPVDNAQGID